MLIDRGEYNYYIRLFNKPNSFHLMPRERRGKCYICGRIGKLSFEHIPPRKAFNERPVIKAQFEELVGLGPDEPITGQIQQRGRGEYTLCPRCNNNTGS